MSFEYEFEIADEEIDSYHLETALTLILGTDELLSDTDLPEHVRIRSVLEASGLFIKEMTKQGYIPGEAEQ